MSNKISDIFPPPNFLNIPYAGVAISDSAIRCIQFGKKFGNLYVEKYAEVALSQGLITGGQINNKEEVVNVLKGLKNDLKLGYVRISLPEEKAYLFTAKIPVVKRDEVISAIESKIEENVPVSPGELTFDYKLIDHRKEDHLDVVVSTVPISVVDSYVELAQLAGLQLLSIEIESQAVARAILPANKKGTVLIVNFDKGKVGLYVVTDVVVRFTSTVQLKGEISYNLDFLSQEIKKLYTYWHTLKENIGKEEKKINKIIICGEDFGEDAMTYLTSQNQTSISMGDVWINAFDINTFVPKISFKDSLKYAEAVGLALPSETLIYNNHE